MVLTTAEAAWIGIGIGGVLTWLGAWGAFLAVRNKEHQQRKWDRTADLYEHVLFETASWAATRDQLMRRYGPSETDGEIPTLDNADRQRTRIKLKLFGHREVQDAFERYAEAHWKWAGCDQALQDVYEQNRQVREGLMPPSEEVSTEEVRRKVDERKTANHVANEQEAELGRAIEGAVRRVPKPDRWFRRAPRAIGRWRRSTWQHVTSAPAERRRREKLRSQ